MKYLSKTNLLKLSLLSLIINTLYCFTMWINNGGIIPYLFTPKKASKVSDSLFLRRRLYGIEFWISFIGVSILISLLL